MSPSEVSAGQTPIGCKTIAINLQNQTYWEVIEYIITPSKGVRLNHMVYDIICVSMKQMQLTPQCKTANRLFGVFALYQMDLEWSVCHSMQCV